MYSNSSTFVMKFQHQLLTIVIFYSFISWFSSLLMCMNF